MALTCPHCNEEVKEPQKFCSHCGALLSGPPASESVGKIAAALFLGCAAVALGFVAGCFAVLAIGGGGVLVGFVVFAFGVFAVRALLRK